jgi:hypothetical protein
MEKKSIATMKIPKTQLFIKSRSNDEPSVFRKAIYDVIPPSYLINHRHIYPRIDQAEFATMESNRPQNGE